MLAEVHDAVPAGLMKYLGRNERYDLPENGPPIVREHRPFEPPKIKAQTAEILRGVVAKLEACLAPGEKPLIQARIQTLLEHYFIPSETMPGVERMVAHDWWKALESFPTWAALQVCADWRDTERRRPSPADIRKRCQLAVDEYERLVRKLRMCLEQVQLDQSDGGTEARAPCKSANAYNALWKAKQPTIVAEIGQRAWGAFCKDLVPIAPATDPDKDPYRLGAQTAFLARLVAERYGEILARILGRPVEIIRHDFSQIALSERIARQERAKAEAEQSVAE